MELASVALSPASQSPSVGRFLVGGATEHSHQPPDEAKPSPGNQRAKTLQLFLILLLGRYRSWVAESDSNTRGKSMCLPFERSHFECQRFISRFVASL
jgi:hypothetical protein